MKDRIKSFIEEVEKFQTGALEEMETFRLKFLSKKGIIPALFGELKNAIPEERKQIGLLLNELKTKAEEKLSHFRDQIDLETGSNQSDADLSIAIRSA
jgi:phenylalanyl-tRNA synthetase alpha chain